MLSNCCNVNDTEVPDSQLIIGLLPTNISCDDMNSSEVPILLSHKEMKLLITFLLNYNFTFLYCCFIISYYRTLSFITLQMQFRVTQNSVIDNLNEYLGTDGLMKKFVLFMDTNSVVGRMPLIRPETLMRCLMTMWRTSELCPEGLRGFGLLISVLKINPVIGLQSRSIMMS